MRGISLDCVNFRQFRKARVTERAVTRARRGCFARFVMDLEEAIQALETDSAATQQVLKVQFQLCLGACLEQIAWVRS
jgi:hypothetical protein